MAQKVEREVLVFLRQTLLFAIKSGAEVSGEGVLKKIDKIQHKL